MAHVRRILILALVAAIAACGGPAVTPPPPEPDPQPPEVSGVAPSVAPRGATIVISGEHFGASGNVTIGGVPADVTSWSDDEIQAVVAAGTPDAYQEVEVTTDDGSDAFSPFFVGVEFTGDAADLQDFLDGLPDGTAALLQAESYDLSAATDELLIDNRSLYGRGEAATTLVAPLGVVVLADFDAAVTVADLTIETDLLVYFHGTLVGVLGTASTSSWMGAQETLEFGARTVARPSVAPLAMDATAALRRPMAGFAANDVPTLVGRSSVGLPQSPDRSAVAIDGMPSSTVAPAGVAYPQITLANVTLTEVGSGGFYGIPFMVIPAVELTLTGVTIDAPATAVFLFSSQDVVLEETDVTGVFVFLLSFNGSVAVRTSSLVSASDLYLFAESGLSVTASTVRAEDGDIEIVGAVLALVFGSGFPTGGPVTISESTIEALDADLADGNDVGWLLVESQFAPIALRDNVLIRSMLDTTILNHGGLLGEGDVTLAGNADVRVGVSQADEPVHYRQSVLAVQTGATEYPNTLTLDGNVIDATWGLGAMAGGGEPGNLVVRGNEVSAGDGFDSGAVVMYAGSPGTLTLASNVIEAENMILTYAPYLDGGTASWDGNTMAVVGDSFPIVEMLGFGGSCDISDNDLTVEDSGADDPAALYMRCLGADATRDAFTVAGNDLAVAGDGSSVVLTFFATGPLSFAANAVTSEVMLLMELPDSEATIADNIIALGTDAIGWLIAGDGDTDLTLSGNVAGYTNVGVYGLLLQGIGNAVLTGNAFSSTGAPALTSRALAVSTATFGTPVAVSASGNTFTNFARALYFGDQAGAAIGIDAAVNGNVFDFVIDAAPKVAELLNVADAIDARNNQWGTNTVLATVESYVTLSGDTGAQGGSILLDPIAQP